MSTPRLIVLALVLAAPAAGAAPDPGFETVTVYDGALTMEIPDGWQSIDALRLDELTMRAADATAGRLVEVYQYGFRPSDPGDDTLLPSLLVQVRESGRVRSGAVARLASSDRILDTTERAFPDGLRPLVMGVAVDRARFDTASHCLRLEHTLDLRFKGRVVVLTAAFLTERGFVTLRLADREQRIEAARALFDHVVSSVRLSPEIAYRPRLSDRWPGLPFFAAAAVVALALVVYLVRRRRAHGP